MGVATLGTCRVIKRRYNMVSYKSASSEVQNRAFARNAKFPTGAYGFLKTVFLDRDRATLRQVCLESPQSQNMAEMHDRFGKSVPYHPLRFTELIHWIILSGYPYSAHDDDAPHVYPGIYALGVPILGMRYAFQEICWNHKGRVAKCDHREYGLAEVQISRSGESDSAIRCRRVSSFRLSKAKLTFDEVWMSHGDQLSVMPSDFHVIGRTNAAPYAAIAHNSKSLHGIRRIPRQESSSLLDNGEVITALRLFVMLTALQEEFIGQEIVRIREICGPRGRVIGVVSGGVDSTVTAKNARLWGVFETEAAKIEEAAEKEENGAQAKGKIEWLLPGALYPDVIGSISFKGLSATTTAHHNVDEVRALGRLLSIPAPLVQRHPFPGPGLAIRILGPVTREQVKILQQADRIYIEGIHKANLYNQISQATAILLPVKAIGVMGDKRTYKQVIALRAVTSEDFMTADRYAFPPKALRWISSRITNEVNGIDRVTYDISSKPPLGSEQAHSPDALRNMHRSLLYLFILYSTGCPLDLYEKFLQTESSAVPVMDIYQTLIHAVIPFLKFFTEEDLQLRLQDLIQSSYEVSTKIVYPVRAEGEATAQEYNDASSAITNAQDATSSVQLMFPNAAQVEFVQSPTITTTSILCSDIRMDPPTSASVPRTLPKPQPKRRSVASSLSERLKRGVIQVTASACG
ncbi:hypothetical protein F4604DRAFT_2043213 [Suillus subluteus]|nr:hypothetical protein F4604DRAFT_2043213 [Suillus subluteus]